MVSHKSLSRETPLASVEDVEEVKRAVWRRHPGVGGRRGVEGPGGRGLGGQGLSRGKVTRTLMGWGLGGEGPVMGLREPVSQRDCGPTLKCWPPV